MGMKQKIQNGGLKRTELLKNANSLLHPHEKSVTNYVLEWMGLNFYDYDGIQPKLSPPQAFLPAV